MFEDFKDVVNCEDSDKKMQTNVKNSIYQILKSKKNENILSLKNLDDITKSTGLLGLFVNKNN